MSLSCGVFFLLDCALRQAWKIPAEFCTLSFCISLSLHCELSLIHVENHSPLLVLPTLSLHLFFSPLWLHFDFLLSCLSLCFSLCFMLVCIAVFQYFLHQYCLPVTVGMPVCLFLSSSLFLLISSCLSGCLLVCFYFLLCMFLAGSQCLSLLPTLYISLSALLHLSLNAVMYLHASDVFLFSLSVCML